MKSKVFVVEPLVYYQELGIKEVLENNFILCHPHISSSKSEELIKECDLVISFIYHSFLSIYFFSLAQKYSIPTVHFSDGIEDWANMTKNNFFVKKGLMQNIPPYADVCFVTTLEAKKIYRCLGAKVYMYYPKRVFCESDTHLTKKIDTQSILLTCANTPCFSDGEFDRLVELYNKIINILDDEGIKYGFRISNKELIKKLNIPNRVNFLDGSFIETAVGFSAIITTPSSIVVPAVKADIPVALLDYRDGPMLLQTGWRCHASCNIKHLIEGLLRKDPSRMLYQRQALSTVTDNDDIGSILKDIADEGKFRRKEIIDYGIKQYYKSPATLNVEYIARYLYKVKGLKRILRYLMKK
ncbi:hypothetical protein [Cobetia amphilecti]|uniref:hypothetical protein n=1 Tax=Cobetia amphilecti TaxID=1055104 RepID=UPI00244BFC32|nr:hypothetical protein [Cobetia litoralis]MDH2421801.1 hypothetical protein [Cobetia litoralis]